MWGCSLLRMVARASAERATGSTSTPHRYSDARREVQFAPSLDASSQVLAWQFVDSGTSPSDAAQREEWAQQLRDIIDGLPAADKEILALRHFEQLSPAETAQVLQISDKASGMRYLRALKRLRDGLACAPGGLSRWKFKA